MFDMQTFKPRPDHAVCSVETGLHMIQAIKDVRDKTKVVCVPFLDVTCVCNFYYINLLFSNVCSETWICV